jgi:hypothetical protein
MMTAEFFAHHGGLHAVVKRHEMKSLIAGVLRMTPWYSMLKKRETVSNSQPQGDLSPWDVL